MRTHICIEIIPLKGYVGMYDSVYTESVFVVIVVYLV